MKDYLHWEEESITDFSSENVNTMYNRGFVFGRPENGFMQQTRSIRVDLAQFELSSENKRILRKTEGLEMVVNPLPYTDYHWSIGKLGKDFYEAKFGDGTFSANKVKELLSGDRADFNRLLTFEQDGEAIGYCIAVETPEIVHYSYPFYDLKADKNIGMGMMVRAVDYAKQSGKQYIYLGSFQRPGDTYKLQFKGLEWFDGKEWQSDLESLKQCV